MWLLLYKNSLIYCSRQKVLCDFSIKQLNELIRDRTSLTPSRCLAHYCNPDIQTIDINKCLKKSSTEGWREKQEEELHRRGHGSASKSRQPGIWLFFFRVDVPKAPEKHPPRSGEHIALGTRLPVKADVPSKPALLEVETNRLRRLW